ncbi:DNA replication complex GINS protein PSF3-like [Babylonia areolata]|uniref:DNA replication complex GINS protein PSF3-like n=1 Tax=Babylonia areolata TaxID=304850 RepID=UPI003FD640E0
MTQSTARDSEDYFNLDDILATNERIPCRVEMPIHRLGYLDQTTDDSTLQPGTNLELPFWLARSLCSRRRHIVSVEVPRPYRLSYREVFKADPNVVDLHKLGPYFYQFGSHLLSFQNPDAQEVANSLLKTFQGRFRRIMDSSQNALHQDTSYLTEKLDEGEKKIFKAGQQGLHDFELWERRQTEKLKTSTMVLKHLKRKRAIVEDKS